MFGGRTRYRMIASSFPVEVANPIGAPTESQEDNIGAVVLELAQAPTGVTMDERVDNQQNVVDSLDGKNDSLNRPLGSRSDEPLGAPNVELLEVLSTNDTVNLPVVASQAADDQEGWTVVQSLSRRRRAPPVEPLSTSRGGRNGKKGAEKPGGRNARRNGGWNEGGVGGSGQIGSGRTDGGNRSNGSQGLDNWRRRGESGQNEEGRNKGEAQRPPADIAFQRQLHRQSVATRD
ncbi:hypothetical protein FRC07_010764 [Ceratobasidium sp. 392]|nr:hypothetical protein FRC07_010764 [Ceratobasidium sp. 392]